MTTHTFDPMLDGDIIRPCDDIPTSDPSRRHVRIVKPGSGSHRREGQVYLQPSQQSARP